jgi:hypothetical protein
VMERQRGSVSLLMAKCEQHLASDSIGLQTNSILYGPCSPQMLFRERPGAHSSRFYLRATFSWLWGAVLRANATRI